MKFLTISSPLKGNRSYLHGSDIAFELARHVFERGGLKLELSLNAFSKNEVYCLSGSDVPPGDKRVGYGAWSNSQNNDNKFLLIEGDRKIEQRREYDEEIIEKACKKETDGIISYQDDLRNYNVFEIMIAMKKAFLISKYPAVDVKWWFAKITLFDLNYVLNKNDNVIEIRRAKSLGLKLVTSDVFFNGVKLGQITFISTAKGNNL